MHSWGGGVWHDAAPPLPEARHSPLSFLEGFLSVGAMHIGLSNPSALALPVWPMCQQSPQTVPVSLLCIRSTEEGNHWAGESRWRPHTGGGGTLPNGGCWALGCPLVGSLHDKGTQQPSICPFPHSVTQSPGGVGGGLQGREREGAQIPPARVYKLCAGRMTRLLDLRCFRAHARPGPALITRDPAEARGKSWAGAARN